MTVPTATIALLLLLVKLSYCYVPSLRVSFTLGDSKRTTIQSVLDHSQRSQHGLTLAATNDPIAPLPLASVSELERKIAELELEKAEAKRMLAEAEAKRRLKKAQRKLEKAQADRRLEKAKRKLEKAKMERKQGRKSISSSSFIVFTLILPFMSIVIAC